MNWYQYPVSNPFGASGGESQWGGHSGIDLATPNNTPLFFPNSGTVIVADFKQYGGEVAIQVDNTVEYFLHLNTINVQVGQQVQSGQQVGTSGGGVGDTLASSNGTTYTATSQSQWGDYSSGYHTHFGLVNVSSGNPVQDYYSALGSNIDRINPTSMIQSLASGNSVSMIPTSDTSNSSNTNVTSNVLNSWFNSSIAPEISTGMLYLGFIVIALILLIIGMQFLLSPIEDKMTPALEHVAAIGALA
jgi:hypothetical protein